MFKRNGKIVSSHTVPYVLNLFCLKKFSYASIYKKMVCFRVIAKLSH